MFFMFFKKNLLYMYKYPRAKIRGQNRSDFPPPLPPMQTKKCLFVKKCTHTHKLDIERLSAVYTWRGLPYTEFFSVGRA